jgi:hypothetical protein
MKGLFISAAKETLRAAAGLTLLLALLEAPTIIAVARHKLGR